MLTNELKSKLMTEFSYSASRSSGAGGQHVNKVNSKIEIQFNVSTTQFLTNIQKEKIMAVLKNRINQQGIIVIQSQQYRSQYKNKVDATQRLLSLIETAIRPVEKRIATKASKASVKKRLENKKKLSEKKRNRRPPSV